MGSSHLKPHVVGSLPTDFLSALMCIHVVIPTPLLHATYYLLNRECINMYFYKIALLQTLGTKNILNKDTQQPFLRMEQKRAVQIQRNLSTATGCSWTAEHQRCHIHFPDSLLMWCSCLRQQGQNKEHEDDKNCKTNPKSNHNGICQKRENNTISISPTLAETLQSDC